MNWERWAWLLAGIATGVLGGTDPWLGNSIGLGPTFTIYAVGGIAIGWTWYQLYPRPLADRMFAFACFVVLAAFVAVLPGDGFEVDNSLVPVIYLGVVAGLTFNEQRSREGSSWDRQRHASFTTRKSDDNAK